MKQIVEMEKLEPAIREVVGAGGTVRLTVTGQSMFPTLIENRDSVVLVKPSKLKKGDIVLYQRQNGAYVLHRIVKIKNDEFYLCGDNQTAIEFPIYERQIFAVVSAIARKDKIISVTDKKYRIVSFIWSTFIPLRPFFLRTVVKMKRKTS